AAVGGEAQCSARARPCRFAQYWHWALCEGREQVRALTGRKLDEHMVVGCIHQVALGVVAERLNQRSARILLDADEAPGAEQRAPQVLIRHGRRLVRKTGESSSSGTVEHAGEAAVRFRTNVL